MYKLNKDAIENPGSGTYNPSQRPTSSKAPTWKVGTGIRRPLSAIPANPGPGMYDPKLEQHGSMFSQTSKKVYEHDERVPGPGTYEPVTSQTKLAVTNSRIGQGPKVGKDTSTRKDNPGPGTYQHERPKTAGPSFGFGTG